MNNPIINMPVFQAGDKVLVQSPTSDRKGETAIIQYRCKGLSNSIYHVRFSDAICRNFRADSLQLV